MFTSGSERAKDSRYKTIIILVVVFAALSNASKDFKQAEEWARGAQAMTADWLDHTLMAVSARTMPNSCVDDVEQRATSNEEFRWQGHIATGGTIEVKGVSGNIRAEASNGDEVEVIARKRGRRSNLDNVRIDVVESPNRVTICAIYPSSDFGKPNSCEAGDGGRMSANSNDVQVDFIVKVPQGLEFAGQTVNGEIAATSLEGNVSSRTVNGSITISTSGYADAKTVNGEISARLGSAAWTGTLHFESVNGAINLELPAAASTEVTADTFNGEISSEFAMTVSGEVSRKHLDGSIGSGGRQLVIKTLNGSINLRKAG